MNNIDKKYNYYNNYIIFQEEVYTMKDMISKIIEMDEKARELTDMAQKDKINSYQEIAAKREKLHDDYIKRARKRIEINYKRELKISEQNERKLDEQTNLKINKLCNIYEKNKDSWVKSIVRNVLEE